MKRLSMNMNFWLKALNLLFLVGMLIAFDQVTKYLSASHLVYHQPLKITSFLNFTLTFNSGVSFGTFAGYGIAGKYVLSVIAVVFSIVLTRWYFKTDSILQALAFIHIIGGAIGNLIDRMRFGHVIDFIDFHWGAYHPFIFNMADVFINIGVLCLILDSVLEFWHKKNNMTKEVTE